MSLAEGRREALAFARVLAPLEFFVLAVRWVDTWLDGPAEHLTPIEEHEAFDAMSEGEESF